MRSARTFRSPTTGRCEITYPRFDPLGPNANPDWLKAHAGNREPYGGCTRVPAPQPRHRQSPRVQLHGAGGDHSKADARTGSDRSAIRRKSRHPGAWWRSALPARSRSRPIGSCWCGTARPSCWISTELAIPSLPRRRFPTGPNSAARRQGGRQLRHFRLGRDRERTRSRSASASSAGRISSSTPIRLLRQEPSARSQDLIFSGERLDPARSNLVARLERHSLQSVVAASRRLDQAAADHRDGLRRHAVRLDRRFSAVLHRRAQHHRATASSTS